MIKLQYYSFNSVLYIPSLKVFHKSIYSSIIFFSYQKSMQSHSPTRLSPVSVSELQTMRLRVDNLSKEHARYKKNLTHTYQNLLKVIDNKLNHDEHESKKLNRIKKIEEQIQTSHEKVRVMRDKQQQQLKKIKLSYYAMKKQQSAEIKEFQKREKINTLRKQEIQTNRKRQVAERIKVTHQEIRMLNERQMIENKKKSVQKMKRDRVNAKYPKDALAQMNQLQAKARTLAIELGCSQIYDQQVQELTKQANKMKVQEFHKIAIDMRVPLTARQEVKKKLAEELLKKKNLASLFHK